FWKEREKVIKDKIKSLKKAPNITLVLETAVTKIVSKHSLILSNQEKIEFQFLVGADGSNSIVRKYLNLPIQKFGLAMHYLLLQKFPNFEVHFDNQLFGSGYLWIFPHQNYTSLGCGSDSKNITGQELKNNLELWLKQKKINFSQTKFEAAVINYDFRGYHFDNLFLTGDAAGLTSGLTGKGIYSAFLSGKQVAKEILGQDTSPNLIEIWLKKKDQQEKYLFFLKNPFLRKIVFPLGMTIGSWGKIQKKALEMIG
ncbi:MAG: FAD-dependent monooxygenase, partial [Patescibacteria group bacterium]|nr:FAD-dependent monooxygenase [Patescibacteria group bacterium]